MNINPHKTIMKLFISSCLTLFAISCSNSNAEIEALQKKQDDEKCQLEFMTWVMDHGDNTMMLAIKKDMKKELDAWNKIYADKNISCDSLKNSWSRFADLVSK